MPFNLFVIMKILYFQLVLRIGSIGKTRLKYCEVVMINVYKHDLYLFENFVNKFIQNIFFISNNDIIYKYA